MKIPFSQSNLQLSADSITSSISPETNAPGGSHSNPVTQKIPSELSSTKNTHTTPNRNSPALHLIQPTQLTQQNQIGNLNAEITLLALDNSNSSSSSHSNHPKVSQPQIRPNLSQGSQNSTSSSGMNNTNGTNTTASSTNYLAANNSCLQSNPTTSANGAITSGQTSNGSSPGSVHRPRRSSRNLEDSSSRRSSRTTRQSTSNAQVVNLVRSGAQFARPTLNLPPGYGTWSKNWNSYAFNTIRIE